jgi:uncharacterized membrane protein YphA (DoxX/SURF4 family)
MEARRCPPETVVMMTATSAELAVPTQPTIERSRAPAFQAFQILRLAFVAAPVLMGADKFFNLLCNWEKYLAPSFLSLSPLSAAATMHVVGVIEIVAGIVVALKPRLGAYVVAAWLAGIILNLLLVGGYYDVALRDFGLCLAALALARLSATYDRPGAQRAV